MIDLFQTLKEKIISIFEKYMRRGKQDRFPLFYINGNSSWTNIKRIKKRNESNP